MVVSRVGMLLECKCLEAVVAASVAAAGVGGSGLHSVCLPRVMCRGLRCVFVDERVHACVRACGVRVQPSASSRVAGTACQCGVFGANLDAKCCAGVYSPGHPLPGGPGHQFSHSFHCTKGEKAKERREEAQACVGESALVARWVGSDGTVRC